MSLEHGRGNEFFSGTAFGYFEVTEDRRASQKENHAVKRWFNSYKLFALAQHSM